MDTIAFRMWMKSNARDVREDSVSWEIAEMLWELKEQAELEDTLYLEGNIDNLESEVSAREYDITELEDQIESLEEELSFAKDETELVEANLYDTKNELIDALTISEELRDELDELQFRMDSLEK